MKLMTFKWKLAALGEAFKNFNNFGLSYSDNVHYEEVRKACEELEEALLPTRDLRGHAYTVMTLSWMVRGEINHLRKKLKEAKLEIEQLRKDLQPKA